MKGRIKVFSNFDFISKGRYFCPDCGAEINSWQEVKVGKSLSTPFGMMKEYILTCPECDQVIDYLLASKPGQ